MGSRCGFDWFSKGSFSSHWDRICVHGSKSFRGNQDFHISQSFLDWNDYFKFYKLGTTGPYTPSIQFLYVLRDGLDFIFEEVVDNVVARHTRLGLSTRFALEA